MRKALLIHENKLLYILLFFMIILLGIQVYQNNQGIRFINYETQTSSLTIGASLPSITLQDLDGNPFRSDSLEGEYLLIFLHSECEYCKLDHTLWFDLYERSKNLNISLIGIAGSESPDIIKKYAEENNIPFPIMIDREGILFSRDWVDVTPTKVLVSDTKGILQIWRGWTTKNSGDEELGSLYMLFDIHPNQLPHISSVAIE